MTGTILLIVGIVIFLVGYFYAGVAQGQGECVDKVTKEKLLDNKVNYQGGIAGVVIGIVLAIVGYFLSLN